ncbi:unnamed protein product [Phyllotreta striolata]|uniref:F-box domain-containing protein n=1 Tax=Phyllotreta striolata TaxID=444603 RepID=A0A9N9XKI9_PHYSR|nr:unnamed protein product [Phyllotreta striolata]
MSDASESSYLDRNATSVYFQNNASHIGYNRKRKASYNEKISSDEKDLYSPQLSSTLNDSMELVNKDFANRKFSSVPNTPEQHVKHNRGEPVHKRANTSSFVKHFSQIGIHSQSPLRREAYDILYPELPSLEPAKRPQTPSNGDKTGPNPAKKRLFQPARIRPLTQILSNTLIMNKILRQLSNGDLYRLAKVSTRFRNAIANDFEAYPRYVEFLRAYKHQKENYKITPPNSPETVHKTDPDLNPELENFNYFCEFAKILNKNQSLVKCPRCQRASIVDNDIAQCQDVNRCGYIFCKRCNSFADHPKDFVDKCNNAQLLNASKSRNLLGDLSNSPITSDYGTGNSSSFFSSSLTLSSSSSCILSECEASTPKERVRRNLSKSLLLSSEMKIFCSNARNDSPQRRKSQRRASLVPVVSRDGEKRPDADVMEPSSPPKVKMYSVCSKQSKRNLKRL